MPRRVLIVHGMPSRFKERGRSAKEIAPCGRYKVGREAVSSGDTIIPGKGNRMGILQNGLTPRLRPALLFLPFPILLTVAIACFAQPKYEIASPAIADSL